MSRRPTISVFGSNDLTDFPEVESLVEELGKAIVDNGCRVACGGLGGVMTAICRGAHSSDNYSNGDTIGIIPQEDFEAANEFVDVVIPTGLGLFRNMLVARAGDACIAVKGGAGTLSEIAFAWQIQKPVAVMSTTGGWSTELAGTPLDHRYDTEVADLPTVEAAIGWINSVTKQ
ncbi:MAG: TIGR00725 family protein [Candidatus Thermoplasmatota archaeon]|nr:TIGR00725 family protein [Candidatus Thermoplasmatota archaeon]MEE3201041.1 TIGR00725 family protein [Candidatus Thermoplasmatota archaeon]